MSKDTFHLGSGWAVETSELESQSPVTSFLSQNPDATSRSLKRKRLMTQISEGVKLCVLATVDEKGVCKCFVSARGQERREGPVLAPWPDNGQLAGFTTCFDEPNRDDFVEGQPGVKGQGWRVHGSGLRKQ